MNSSWHRVLAQVSRGVAMLKRIANGVVSFSIELWDFDFRAPAIARRHTVLRAPSKHAAQTHAESTWRRHQARHCRAREAAWRATLKLAKSPHAWLAQAGEIFLFLIKFLCAYWGAASAILLLWCLATSTPTNEVPAEGKAAAATLVGLWQALRIAWWVFRLRLPIKSPFLESWRTTYDDAAARPKPLRRHSGGVR